MSNYEFEVLFVNDGSTDNTLNILEEIAKLDKNIKVISFSRNFGHQNAVTAGLKYVSGNLAIIIDADLQDPPEIIPKMVELWEQGNEVVYGKRKRREGESVFKLVTAKMFYKTLNKLSDVEIPKDTGDFRLIDKKVVDVINSMPEHNKFLRGLFSWVGFEQKAFEYERKERFAGKTKYPLKKMLKLASDGIIGFSTKPLKMVGGLGVLTICVSFVILIYALLSFIFKWNNLTPGWTSLMVAITFFSGIILISLWMIGEYISRIYDESKGRPQYIINKEINKKNSSSEESGKEKEEENGLKVTDLNAVTPDMRPNAWEENLQEAMNDTSWYEVVAIQSGIPRLMMEEKEWFFNYLREQIILRGNESSMNSLHEIKNYFANLTRQGSHVSSTTQVALKKFLKNRQEQQQCSPYETITNGIRTYDGHPIPAYAKPRPSAAHIWNPVTNEWTR